MKFTENKTPKEPSYPMLMKHKQFDIVMLAIDKNRGIVIEDNRDNPWKTGSFVELEYQNFGTHNWTRIHGTIEF